MSNTPSVWFPTPSATGSGVSDLNYLSGVQIPVPEDGILVFVNDTGGGPNSGSYFQLSLLSGAPIDGVNVIGTFLGGLSRWLKRSLGAGGTVAGAIGDVQFNSGLNSFAADPNFNWNNVLKALGLGTSATNRLTVSAIPQTLAPPTSLAIVATAVPTLHAPTTMMAAQVIGPDNPSAPSGTINDPDPNGIFTADGSDWTVNIYGVVQLPGQFNSAYFFNTPGAILNFDLGVDANDGNPISFTVNWTPGTLGDGTLVQLMKNGGLVFTVFVSGLVTSNVIIDITQTDVSSFGAFDFAGISYQPQAGGATANPPAGMTAIENTADTGFTENGSTYAYSVDSYNLIDNRKWASGTPFAAIPFTDGNMGLTFGVDLTIVSGGAQSGFIIQRVINGGTPAYADIGNSLSFTDSDFPNDAHAAAIYNAGPYPGIQPIPRTYGVFGSGVVSGPGGTSDVYYSATGHTQTFGPFADAATGYVNIVTTSPSVTNGLKFLGSADGLGFGGVLTGSAIYVDGPNQWGPDFDVSRKTVGFAGNGQSIAFEAFSFTSSPSVFYSSGHTDASLTFPNDSIFRTIVVTSTGGTPTQKWLIDTGSGFNFGRFQSVGSQFFWSTDGTSAGEIPVYNQPNTVTPTSVGGTAAMLISGASLETDFGQLALVGQFTAIDFYDLSGGIHSKISSNNNIGLGLKYATQGSEHGFYRNGVNIASLSTQYAVFNPGGESTSFFFTVGHTNAQNFLEIQMSSSFAFMRIGNAGAAPSTTLGIRPFDTNTTALAVQNFDSGGLQPMIIGLDSLGTTLFSVSHSGFVATHGLTVKGGSNARIGSATLGVGGTVTVANTSVAATDVLFITYHTAGGTPGTSTTYTLSSGASFTVTSNNAADRSTFVWQLIGVN